MMMFDGFENLALALFVPALLILRGFCVAFESGQKFTIGVLKWKMTVSEKPIMPSITVISFN
ncbi:hypothetical protein A8B75_19260 [Sphingomonadales bacterium EhC05]|nr:hypothetical protein A8B75_19260 [Sphingomonadales bacterium EhC05]